MIQSTKFLLLSSLLTVVAGCASQPRLTLPPPLASASAAAVGAPEQSAGQDAGTASRGLKQAATPTLPAQDDNIAGAEVKVAEPTLTGPAITASIADMPLPTFINEAFGNQLHLNFQLDPALDNKTDLVTLRLPAPQTPRDFYRLAVQLLREYGVAAEWDGSVLNLTASGNAQGKEPPLLISGRTLPDVPISHRPIFQLVELQSVRNRDVTNWLKMAYESDDLKIDEDVNRNAVVLFGKPDLVAQAVAAIKLLDRPFMRGRYSTRLEPAYVSATDLAQRLTDVLSAEGYGVSNQAAGTGSNTLVLPVSSANIVLVFSADPDVLAHVVEWARSIDKPNENAANGSIFYYQVKNTKASDLAAILRSLGGNGAGGEATNSQAPAAGSGPRGGGGGATDRGGSGSAPFGGGRVTVDGPRNAIIFQGDASDWQHLLSLVRQMDKSTRQVMIEVTIAEVSLDDNEEFGVSWLAKDSHGKYNGRWASGTVPTGTADSGSAAGGLTYLLDVAGQNRAQLKAFADDSRVSILSTPRLLVKSGEEASIDVGTEVPTITAQTTSGQQTGGTSNLLQSIEYRKTGIILDIKPTVYSDNRIDLDISQEVSEALPVSSSDTVGSPSIFNRSVKTSLSLRDGGSVLLGGLMSERHTSSGSGVPVLKDVPVLGNLFKSQSRKKSKTELVLIIVPYIIESDSQAQAITEAISDRLEYIEMPTPLRPAASDAAAPTIVPPADAPASAPAPEAPTAEVAPTARVGGRERHRVKAGEAALAAPEPGAAPPANAPTTTATPDPASPPTSP